MKSVQIEESKEMQPVDLNYENSPPPAMRHLNSSKKDMILKKPKQSLKSSKIQAKNDSRKKIMASKEEEFDEDEHDSMDDRSIPDEGV